MLHGQLLLVIREAEELVQGIILVGNGRGCWLAQGTLVRHRSVTQIDKSGHRALGGERGIRMRPSVLDTFYKVPGANLLSPELVISPRMLEKDTDRSLPLPSTWVWFVPALSLRASSL